MRSDGDPGQRRPAAAARPAVAPTERAAPAANGGLRIGVLIVAYNAERTIAAVLDRIPAAVWANAEEVAVFDDASSDATVAAAGRWAEARQAAHGGRLRVVANERNLGYGGNQKLGYRSLIDRGFDVAVLLHGDGQYAPELLPALYAPIVDGAADAVFGTRMTRRYGGPLRGGMPLYKLVGNRILTALANACLGTRLSEFHCGYRAYRLAALGGLSLATLTDDFHFDTQIIVKLHHQRLRIREVPVPTYYGDEVCHVNGLRYAWNVARTLLAYRRTLRPGAAYRAPEYAEYRPAAGR